MSGEVFNEDYFERGELAGLSLYSQYRWLPELTIPLAHSIVVELGLAKFDTVLDWGCAKGFLVRAFRLLHHSAWGYDISAYAIGQAPADVRGYVSTEFPAQAFDWVVSKDVLEHVAYEEIDATLKQICKLARRAFIIVPLGDGQKYNFADYEKDVTHVIRQPIDWWRQKFREANFEVDVATTEMPYVKKSRCEASDGFFILRGR